MKCVEPRPPLHATRFAESVGDAWRVVEKRVGELVWGAMRHIARLEVLTRVMEDDSARDA